MVFDILTKEDLQQFKKELFEEIRQVLKRENSAGIGDKEWLRSREVRKKLDISPGTLQNLRITGTLPYKKIGGSMYYRSSDVDKMMEGGNGNG
ncbi:Helix-turn-helix domain [Sphingobacterium multivorum]|uniref:helix-turn-helix domain-containing protein n=1 Tax=Sphingobacterium multivorum TaxID=28454 RepID=UPI000E079083|nr:helix-turn-helix domain-containing protein [Sphingobacterium multivorum]QQT43504.1 helix-turn-helix domain-containing protein [Sphingobacterium multivorum]SUI98010.1 Helix-turn-helix domain [Sphingobacterium multivorum]